MWKNYLFLSVPRWKEGIPSTLNFVKLPKEGLLVNEPLIPYPSWDDNEFGDCEKLQWVQSMAIDDRGIMWALDKGRFWADNMKRVKCPTKIVLMDLNNDGKVVKSVNLPRSITGDPSVSFINDIRLDVSKRLAYISDTGGKGAIIVFDEQNTKFYRFEDEETMAPEKSYQFVVNGYDYGPDKFTSAVNGIALSPDAKRVFYCPFKGDHMYSVGVEELMSSTGKRLEKTTIVNHGQKKTATDGMIFDCSGNLYYAGLTSSSLWSWMPNFNSIQESKVTAEQERTVPDRIGTTWIDSFTIRDTTLYFTANHLNEYFVGNPSLNFSSSNVAGNFHVWAAEINSSSYTQCSRGLETWQIVLIVVGSLVLLMGAYFLRNKYLWSVHQSEKQTELEPVQTDGINVQNSWAK